MTIIYAILIFCVLIFVHEFGHFIAAKACGVKAVSYTHLDVYKRQIHNRENLVVIDEAYVDFGAESVVSFIERYDNLMVVQTLSKSRSLAGARVGIAMGNEKLIADMNRIKFSFNPYNLNRLSILAGAEAMKDRRYFEETRRKIMDTREEFVKDMESLGFRILP